MGVDVMKIHIHYDDPEELFSNIGFAKALTEMPALNVSDLCEISRYLMVFCESRSYSCSSHPFPIGWEMKEGGNE
jgi:hypothetical protein